MREFCVEVENNNAQNIIMKSLLEILGGETPVFVCVGTDASIGDSVGPFCGTFLENTTNDIFIYGTLQKPITAKDIRSVKNFISKVHPFSKVVVIDAAIGKKADVGKIKIYDAPIKPGLGLNKNLPELGDVSIIAIVAERAEKNLSLSNFTRLSPIYKMARVIEGGITAYLENNKKLGYKAINE